MADFNDIEYETETFREANFKCVEKDSACQQILNKIKSLERFIDDFCVLTFGRDFVIVFSEQGSKSFSLNNIMVSLELTMGSIFSCCKSASLADAYTLLRKYRDDLFFYLYISVYKDMEMESEKSKSMALHITKWYNNNLSDFKISQILKSISESSRLKDAIAKYKLKDSFNKIGENLNNYVHSNGRAYYNRRYVDYLMGKSLISELEKLESCARYITIVFLLLLIMCSPGSVMSTDYIDCLDLNETPPKDSQYWVAPFVEQFVKQNIPLIDSNCLEYLRENTSMQF